MNINIPMPTGLTGRNFSSGRLSINGQIAGNSESTETTSFQINRERTGLRHRRRDVLAQHREREMRLQEMEDARIGGIRGQMAHVVNENALLREHRSNLRQTGDALSARISDLNSLTGSANESDRERNDRIDRLIERGLLHDGFTQAEYNQLMEDMREEIQESTQELFALKQELVFLNEEIDASDDFTSDEIARLERLIEEILNARDERRQLNIAIEIKLQKFEQQEEMHERQQKAEERRAALNGEATNRQNPRPLVLDVMGARIDAVQLLSYTRDMLTMEALEIQPESEMPTDAQSRRLERLQSQISRLNEAIEKKVSLSEDDVQALQEAQLWYSFGQNEDEDEHASMINVQL